MLEWKDFKGKRLGLGVWLKYRESFSLTYAEVYIPMRKTCGLYGAAGGD